MRRILLLAVAISAAIACDSTGTNFNAEVEPDVVDDTDVPSNDFGPPPTPPPQTKGVQIGSEGLLGDCTTRVVEAADVLPGFSESAGDTTTSLLGDFTGVLGGTPAALELSASSLEAVEGQDCSELLFVGITGTLAASPTIDFDFTGWALVSPTSAELSGWTATWTGDAVPVLDPAEYDTFEIRIDADLDGTGAVGDVSFEGCRPGLCDTEVIGALDATRD